MTKRHIRLQVLNVNRLTHKTVPYYNILMSCPNVIRTPCRANARIHERVCVCACNPYDITPTYDTHTHTYARDHTFDNTPTQTHTNTHTQTHA